MTRREWMLKRDALADALIDVGATPGVATHHADALAVDLFGVAPVPERWEHMDERVVVEAGTMNGHTVDLRVEGEWVFLEPAVARQMAAAMVEVADALDAVTAAAVTGVTA